MTPSVCELLEIPGLTTAATLPVRTEAPSRPPHSRPELPLATGQLHEFFGADPLPGPAWHPPLTLLTLLAGRYLEKRRLVCVGRACWPSFQLLCAAAEGTPRGKTHLLARTLFLDPLTDQERFWAVGQALRCPGVAVVLADASKMDLNTSRRLQLAAEAGNRGEGMGPISLLTRPYKELETPSWAATRWVVRSQRAARGRGAGDEFNDEEPGHRWRLELKTCRGQLGGARPAQDAPRDWNVEFTYQVFRGTGALHLSAGLGRGTAGTPEARAQSA